MMGITTNAHDKAAVPGDPSPVLIELLSAGEGCAPEDARGLADHRPMALVALHKLGADEARLAAFAQAYAPRLQPAPAPQAWPAGDAWPARLGEPGAWAAYRSLFGQWIAHEGAADMLGQVLPQLMPGVGAAAFHGLIRTAAAVRCGHLGELSSGLAYWACRHLRLGRMANPLAGTDQAPATHDPIALLRELPAGRSTAALISTRMQDAARDGRVNAVAARLMVDGSTLERLSRAAAYAYANTGSLTALHLVTGTQAMRVLTRFFEEPLVAWAWYWQAFAHVVVSARLRAAPPVRLHDGSVIVQAALDSADEHLIKLVEACRDEERVYARRGETLWRAAASRGLASGDGAATLSGARTATRRGRR